MRKFLQILGILFIILFGLSVTSFGVLAYKGRHLDSASKAYVDTTLPAIAAQWNPQTLAQYAAPELFANTTQAERDNFLFQLSLLGPMQKYEGATGQANISDNNFKTSVTALYTARGLFRSGDFTFHIFLIRRNGTWLIAGFHVDRS